MRSLYAWGRVRRPSNQIRGGIPGAGPAGFEDNSRFHITDGSGANGPAQQPLMVQRSITRDAIVVQVLL
ncbi:hypothetical protein [Nocardia gipuzkoensis]|uniref:hypothetical protein n=1 Tax=Nocardia gipuzkoensis TaxID=2749991 RepID=UPI003EE1EC75